MTDERATECAAKVLQTCHMIMRTSRPNIKPRELSFRQVISLLVIRRERGVSLSNLCEHIGGSISGASKLVDNLVEQGYIERKQGREDRRTLELSITDLGRKVLEEMELQEIKNLNSKLASLSDAECTMIDLVMDMLTGILMRE